MLGEERRRRGDKTARMNGRPPYDKSVFINCPFDSRYRAMRDALLFAVYDCGFFPRCALEAQETVWRLPRIISLIRESRFAVHDLSRAGADTKTGLARFNMPLELGIFLGAREFGGSEHKQKTFLVLDRGRYRYQKFISDLNAMDAKTHDNDPKKAIRIVRDWLQDVSRPGYVIPSGSVIVNRYASFRRKLPTLAHEVKLRVADLTYRDLCFLIQEWLQNTAP